MNRDTTTQTAADRLRQWQHWLDTLAAEERARVLAELQTTNDRTNRTGA